MYVLVTTWERAYAGRVSSVGEAGDMFPNHELYLVFDRLEEFGDKGRKDVKGNFGGVKELFVGRRWNEVYLLDGNLEGVLKDIENEGRVTPDIKKGLRRIYPDWRAGLVKVGAREASLGYLASVVG